jgi:aspartate racemase
VQRWKKIIGHEYMSEPQHIGIVACSAEGAALCYRTIALEGTKLMGAHAHPEVSMHTHSLADYMRFIYRDDWDGVASLILSSAEKLAKAGADFLICPDNTLHQAFDRVAPRSPLPWLHIAEEVAAEAARRNFRTLAITGTRYLMESNVYPAKLTPRGIDFLIPQPTERERINRIIFDELVYADFRSESLAYFQKVIARVKNEGCDAVILGCTEIPLLVNDSNSPMPTLDSTRILARAALRRSLSAIRTRQTATG